MIAMSPTRRTALATIGGAAAILLAGCGGSGSSGGAPSSGLQSAQSGSVTVDIKGYAFKPSTITVKPGTKVTFVMQDSGTQHTATGSGNSSFINSPKLNTGQSYTVTFSKPGTYSYTCTIHPYMKGEVIVRG